MPARDCFPKEYGAIIYGRGPIFIQTLAETLGQEVLDQFYRDYYQTYEWEIVSGDDFKALVESHCHCDLIPLFEEWGYPK